MSRGFRSADVTSELSERAASELLERVRQEDAEQARHAAERRAAGQTGVCEDCGAAIELERLEFLPDATRCVACQGRLEQSRPPRR